MDPLLSFFMANQGQARPGTLVFDPFVGTGSTLLSCGHFGSRVFGSDIDKNLITGRGKSSRASSKCKWRNKGWVIVLLGSDLDWPDWVQTRTGSVVLGSEPIRVDLGLVMELG
ncbi:tRNA (guanine(10)-N2)-methyltransferase-like [Exaiptasia diaphana]|nr:tRNA (guanine(10)-N2)-methyltransferase-like [Exaiptasia diaphana]